MLFGYFGCLGPRPQVLCMSHSLVLKTYLCLSIFDSVASCMLSLKYEAFNESCQRGNNDQTKHNMCKIELYKKISTGSH